MKYLGAIGIPVFSGGRAGIGIIVGKSGVYLIGFLIGVIVVVHLLGSAPFIVGDLLKAIVAV